MAWAARRQTVVAQSTAEAEYVASCEARMEGRALANVLTEVLPKRKIDFTLEVDNQAAISLASNPRRRVILNYGFIMSVSNLQGKL